MYFFTLRFLAYSFNITIKRWYYNSCEFPINQYIFIAIFPLDRMKFSSKRWNALDVPLKFSLPLYSISHQKTLFSIPFLHSSFLFYFFFFSTFHRVIRSRIIFFFLNQEKLWKHKAKWPQIKYIYRVRNKISRVIIYIKLRLIFFFHQNW